MQVNTNLWKVPLIDRGIHCSAAVCGLAQWKTFSNYSWLELFKYYILRFVLLHSMIPYISFKTKVIKHLLCTDKDCLAEKGYQPNNISLHCCVWCPTKFMLSKYICRAIRFLLLNSFMKLGCDIFVLRLSVSTDTHAYFIQSQPL